MSDPNRPEDRHRPEDPNRGATGASERPGEDSSRGDGERPEEPTGSGAGHQRPSASSGEPGAEGGTTDGQGAGSRPEGSAARREQGQARTDEASGSGSQERRHEETGRETGDTGGSAKGSGGGGEGGGGGSRLSSTPEPRSRFSLWFVILLLAGAIGALGYFGYQLRDTVRQAQQDLESLDAGQLAERQDEIQQALAESQERAETVSGLQDTLQELEQEQEGISASLEELRTASEDNAEGLTSLSSRVDELASKIEGLDTGGDTDLSALESRVEELASRMDSLSTGGDGPDTTALQDRVEELANRVDSLSTGEDGPDTTALASRVDGLAEQVEALSGRDVDGRVSTLEQQLDERISGLESTLSTRLEELASTQEQLREDLEEVEDSGSSADSDWLKAEAGHLARIAIYRVRYQHDTESALAALREADELLAEVGGEGIPEREAVRTAIDKLVEYSGPDISGIRERITTHMEQIDGMSLPGAPGKGQAPELPGLEEAEQGWQRAFSRAWQRLREGLGKLVRIQHEEETEQLLTPDQAYFLREGLRLQLESVLVSLHNGDQENYRAGLERAADWLEERFDSEDERVSEAAQELRELAGRSIRHDPPAIAADLEPVKPF